MSSTADDNAFGNAFLEQILEYVGDNFQPEDVFDADTLQQWAKDNGFVEVDDN